MDIQCFVIYIALIFRIKCLKLDCLINNDIGRKVTNKFKTLALNL